MKITPDALHSTKYFIDPAPYWERLRHDHPLFWDEKSHVWLLSRYDDVVGILRDHHIYSTRPYREIFRPVIGPTFVEMDGADHDLRRALVAPTLVGNNLGAYGNLIEKSIEQLLDRLPEGGESDLREAVTSRLPLLVIAEVLGLAAEDHEMFYRHAAEILHGLEGGETAVARGVAAHSELAARFHPLIDERLSCPGTDLVSRIVNADVEGRRLTRDEITSFISLILVAGGETTDMAIANMWWGLLTERELLDEVIADPGLLDSVFSESMRRDGAVVYEDRDTTVDVEWYGQEIPAGSRVRVCLGAANRDETAFAEPDRFDIHRPDLRTGKESRAGGRAGAVSGHLTFGAGKHFCLGYQLARLEAVIATTRLLERVRNPRLDPAADNRLRINFFHRRPDRLVALYDRSAVTSRL